MLSHAHTLVHQSPGYLAETSDRTEGKGLLELLSALRWRWLREWFVVIFVALLAAFAIRATLVQTISFRLSR